MIKNKTLLASSNKLIRYVFVISVFLFLSLFVASSKVYAGGKPDGKGNVVGSLCYSNGKVQLIGDDSQRSACLQYGTIVDPGQPVPVPICVLNNKVQQLDATSQGCTTIGGTQVEAGQPLPVVLVPSPKAGDGKTATNTGTIVVDNSVTTKGTCGAGDNAVKTAIDIGCKGKGNPILDALFAIIRFLTVGAGLVMIGSMIVAGIQYSTSRGDPQATSAAIKRIASTFGALLLFIFIYALANWLIPAGILK